MAAPVMLIIRDGWASIPAGPRSARVRGRDIARVHAVSHQLYGDCRWSQLSASGMDVGLPEGQMGNSEVVTLTLEQANRLSGSDAHQQGDRGRRTAT